jgi:hypothetical protein
MIETPRNPKLEGSKIWDCVPQTGDCPIGCNQCFYNREGAFFADRTRPHMPDPAEVGDGIMRVNSGHDSNIYREEVIRATEIYPNRFFNTSIPRFDFPAPVVLTANPQEELSFYHPKSIVPDNLMYVRLRTSASNLGLVAKAVRAWTACGVPVVLTFMAYYSQDPPNVEEYYVWKKRHLNSYWCATPEFMECVTNVMKSMGGRLVTMCGTAESNFCKDCGNCEHYYWLTMKHMRESA